MSVKHSLTLSVRVTQLQLTNVYALLKETNMKVTLTTMSGNTKNINLMTKQEVYDFIEVFQSTLLPNQRVKITCDLLCIDGYMQGDTF